MPAVDFDAFYSHAPPPMSTRLLSEPVVAAVRSVANPDDVRKSFSDVDLDSDGFVNAAGLTQVLLLLGIAPSREDLDALVKLFAFPDGRVSVAEFTHWATNIDESTVDAPAAVAHATQRMRGALMGQGPDALRELFAISPEAEAAGQTATLAPRDLLTRIQTSLGLRSLTLGDVSGVVALSDRNGDGAASYSELKRLLRPAPFAEAITRILRHGAAMLRAGGRTSLSREIGAEVAASLAAAQAARRPYPPPAPDGSPTLTHAALRALLLSRVGLPLTDAQLAALGQALDVDDDGGCDASELLFLAGEGAWAEATARDRETLPPPQQQFDERQRSQARLQAGAAPLPLQQHPPRPRPPAGPLTDYCDLVPPGVDVLDDTWDVPLVLLAQPPHGQYPSAAPPIDTLSGLQVYPAGRGGGGGHFGPLAAPLAVPGALPPPQPYAPAAPYGPVPSPGDVYPLPLPPATTLALFLPHDLAAASLSALRWPLPPHLRPAAAPQARSRGDSRGGRSRRTEDGGEDDWRDPQPPLGAAALHDGYVSSPHPWPGLVDHAFASFATAATAPGVFAQGGSGAPGQPPPPPPPPPVLSLEPRALGQALAALGIPRPSHLLDALAARFAGGPGALPPPNALGPLHRVGGAEFRALVDEIAATGAGAWGLHSVAEARIRRALSAAACGSGGASAAPGEAASAALLTRAEVAYALLAAASGPAALTEAEAAAVAAWAPGPAQATALSAVAGARVLALVEGAALAARHTVPTAAGPGQGGDEESPASQTSAAALAQFVEAGGSSCVGLVPASAPGRGGSWGGGDAALIAAASDASSSGRLSPASSAAAALAAVCPLPDVCPARLVSWLALLAAGGAGVCCAAPPLPPLPVPQGPGGGGVAPAPSAPLPPPGPPELIIRGGELPAITAAAGGSAAPHPHPSASAAPAGPAPPPGCVVLVAALDPLTRHALRKLLGPTMSLPAPAPAAPLLRLFHAGARALRQPVTRGAAPQPPPLPLPCGSGFPGCGDAAPVLSTAFVQIQAGAHAAGSAGRGPLLAGGAGPLAAGSSCPLGLPTSFHPSRLALLASAAPAALSVASALADGVEPDPGGALTVALSGGGAGWGAAAQAGDTAAATVLVPLLLRDAAAVAQSAGSSSGGAPPALPHCLAPSAAVPPAELGSRLAEAAGLGADGFGLSLRLASVLPGSLEHAAAAAAADSPSVGGCLPTSSAAASAAALAAARGGSGAAPLRPLGGAARPTDGSWAFEGQLARPSAATALVRVGAADGIPSPASDAVRACIAGRVLRAAVVEWTAAPDSSAPARFRLLTDCVVLAATWSIEAEERWDFPPQEGPPPAGGGRGKAGPPELVLRCDVPRMQHPPAATSAGGPGAAPPAPVTMLLVELNAILLPPQHGPPGGGGMLVRLPARLAPGGGADALTLPHLPSRDAALATLLGGPASGPPPPLVAAPGAPSASAPSSSDGEGGWLGEEVTCAWGLVPLAQLTGGPQGGGSSSAQKHVIPLTGGSPGAACDVAPGDVLRRRSGWRAAFGGGGGAGGPPTLTLTSLPIAALRVAERQALGRLPLRVAAPRAVVPLLDVWRRALAAAALSSASRAHLSEGAGAGAMDAEPALAVLAALAARPGFLAPPPPVSLRGGGPMPAWGGGGAAALLAAAFDAEARAAARSAPRGAPASHAPSLLAVALRAWAGSGLAVASLAPHLVSTPSAAALPSPPQPRGSSGAPPSVTPASLVGAFAPCAVDVAPLQAPGGWDAQAAAPGGPGALAAAGLRAGDATAAAVAAALSAPAGAVFRGAADGAGLLHCPFAVAEVAAGL